MPFSDYYNAHVVLVQGTFVALLLALSVQIPIRTGVFSFAGAGSYGIGAYSAGILVKDHGWGTFEALGASTVIPGAVGFLLALLLQRLSGLYLGMATIAFDLIVTTVAVNGGSFTGGSQGIYGIVSSPTLTVSYVFWITVVVLAIVIYTERGRLGRRVHSVRVDPELALSMGIRVSRYRIVAFIASGALGGLAGAINILFRTTISPDNIGFPLIVTALTAVIVGGTRSWLGALIGATIFTWLPNVLDFVSEWQAVLYGGLVVIIAVWLPGGIVGTWTTLWRAGRQRSMSALEGTEQTSEPSDMLSTLARDMEQTSAAGTDV